MATFKTRLSAVSKTNGRVILACDYGVDTQNLAARVFNDIRKLHQYVCGIKLNLHLLLPLGAREIAKINAEAHKQGLQTIADVKLNDIGDTNLAAL